MPPATSLLSLEDLKPALAEAFEDEHERQWASDAWIVLAEAGLAEYRNEIGRGLAAINFVAFAEFYKDWREGANDVDREFDYGRLPGLLGLSPVWLDQPTSGKTQKQRLALPTGNGYFNL